MTDKGGSTETIQTDAGAANQPINTHYDLGALLYEDS